MGMVENNTGMGNAFISTKRGSPFVREWYTEYSQYSREKLYHNSLVVMPISYNPLYRGGMHNEGVN